MMIMLIWNVNEVIKSANALPISWAIVIVIVWMQGDGAVTDRPTGETKQKAPADLNKSFWKSIASE